MALCLSCSYLLLRANQYWVPFTWFAPSLVTGLSATLFSRVNTSRGQAISNLFLIPTLFCFVLVKLLCGYEYITAIYLSSLVAFVSISYRNRAHTSLMIKRSMIITLVFALAFGTSIGMHASQLDPLLNESARISPILKSSRAAKINTSAH